MYEQVTSPVTSVDRISALPNEIISIILSNLPVEESARTSILSKRWHKIWLFSPINISDESIIMQSLTYSNQEESSYPFWIINTLSHIISTHPGPINNCYFILTIWDEHHQTLVKLLRTLTQKGIRKLKIYCNEWGAFVLPCFVLECKSLVDVRLWCVSIPDQSQAGGEIFPNLRKLTMALCNVNQDFLVKLLSLKLIIELNLSDCSGLEEVFVIESDSLQTFSVSVDEHTELIIKDAPNLKSFNYYDLTRNCEVVILHAPKLEVLGCIDMGILMLQLGNYQFSFHKKCMKICGEITYMPSIRSLEILVATSCGYQAKSVPHFLKCFPRLEILEVMMLHSRLSIFESFSEDEYDDDNENNDNGDNGAGDDIVVIDDNYVISMSNINCLDHHLKRLTVGNYKGTQAHLEFANLIVANARVLETVTLAYGDGFEEKRIEEQMQFILQNSASRMLRVEFIKEEE